MTDSLSSIGLPPVLDMQSAMSRLDGDHELYWEVVQVFLDDIPVQLALLQESVAADDRVVSERQAHSIKSAAANIGGEAMRQVAGKMERIAFTGTVGELQSAVDELLQEFCRLQLALKIQS